MSHKYNKEIAASKSGMSTKTARNRVELGIADPTLSHHRTSDVAYGGFAVMFTKSY